MKKKILIIHDYPHMEGGGIEVQGFIDAKELVKRGYTVTIASSRTTSETYKQKFIRKKGGVDFVVIESAEQIAKLIQSFDAIHIRATFSLRPGMMSAMRILAQEKKKFVISIHTNYKHIYFSALSQKSKQGRDNLVHLFKKYLLSPYAQIVGVSQSLNNSLKTLKVDKRFSIIHNAKEWRDFTPTKKAKNISRVDITYVGEISSMKGIHTLLGAIVLVKKAMPDVKVRFVGKGTAEDDCISLIRALDLEKNIECVKYIENRYIPDYLTRTKILTLPSLTESWGNIVMEAMGLETTTISSRVEGLIELTKNGTYGFLCEQGNAADFAKTFLGVLRGTLTLPYTKKEIQQYIRTTFSMKKRVDELENIYFAKEVNV